MKLNIFFPNIKHSGINNQVDVNIKHMKINISKPITIQR